MSMPNFTSTVVPNTIMRALLQQNGILILSRFKEHATSIFSRSYHGYA